MIATKTVLVLAGAAMTIAAAPLGQLKLSPESKVWVSGKSTVKDFRCTSKTVDGSLSAPTNETSSIGLGQLVNAAQVDLLVEHLDCNNGTMNEHMRKALNVKQFPRIAFKMSGYEITAGVMTVKGALAMNGQEHPVVLTGTVVDQEGVVHTSATASINMTEWGIKPPSLMMGTMKVKPVVTIGYDIAVKR